MPLDGTMYPMAEQELSNDAIVVRGGRDRGPRNTRHMKDSVRRAREIQHEKGEPKMSVLSVFSGEGLTADEICSNGSKILKKWSHYRATTVGKLREIGMDVSWPRADGHAPLHLPDQPSENDYAKIDAVFGPPEKRKELETKEKSYG